MTKSKDIDWKKIEAQYQLGAMSNREIAMEHGISHTAVGKRAAKYGWDRTLGQQVAAAIEEKLVSDSFHKLPGKTIEESKIESAAEEGFKVVKKERIRISLMGKSCDDMQTNLDFLMKSIDTKTLAMKGREKLETRIAKANHTAEQIQNASVLQERLSRTMSRMIPLERQAWNVDTEQDDDKQPIEVNISEFGEDK